MLPLGHHQSDLCLGPKYIKVLGVMSRKVQSVALYVWARNGYFTRSLGQSVEHCSPSLKKVLCHSRHIKSYTPKLDDPSLAKFFRVWPKSWLYQSAYKFCLSQDCTWYNKRLKCESAILTNWTVQSPSHKNSNLAMVLQVKGCNIQQKPFNFSFTVLLRAASMTMYPGVSTGKFQCSKALCWTLS